jgi:hypothetical protein
MIVRSNYVLGRQKTQQRLGWSKVVRVRAYTWSGPGIRYTDPVDRPNCSVKSVRYNIVVRLKAGK